LLNCHPALGAGSISPVLELFALWVWIPVLHYVQTGMTRREWQLPQTATWVGRDANDGRGCHCFFSRALHGDWVDLRPALYSRVHGPYRFIRGRSKLAGAINRIAGCNFDLADHVDDYAGTGDFQKMKVNQRRRHTWLWLIIGPVALAGLLLAWSVRDEFADVPAETADQIIAP